MASSSSLARRLSRRPTNTMEAEREEFLKAMAVAMGKALSKEEAAVKEKHLRITILGTHKEQGAAYFWDNVVRLQMEGHPLVAWKFAHVFHKVMREGHPNVLKDSAKFKTKISNLGKYWGHLKDAQGYGVLIQHYCKLLLTKLEFHGRNPEVPGNLLMSDRVILGLGGGEVDGLYQLAIEALDYLDDIVLLQRRVFDSMDMSRAQSLTHSGQCRLAPLILCIQDASCLYDALVKVLFFLHARCPHDALVGHRDRFNLNFRALRTFFATSSNLQYYKHLVSIPPLPELPPNFTVSSELGSYVPHRVTVHGQEDDLESVSSEPALASLVDLSVPESPTPTPTPTPQPVSPVPHYAPPETQPNGDSAEKDVIIASLRSDLEDTKTLLGRLRAEFEGSLSLAQSRALELGEENERYRAQAESLQNENNAAAAAQLTSLSATATTNEEKFRKMKDVYAKLREEHIGVLGKLSSLQKEADGSRVSAAEAARAKDASLAACEAMVALAREEWEDPAHLSVQCSPEFLLSRLSGLQQCLDESAHPTLLCHSLCHLLSFLKALANVAPSDKGAALSRVCEAVSSVALSFGRGEDSAAGRAKEALAAAETEVRGLLSTRLGDVSAEEVGGLLEKEMAAMDAAIRSAAAKIQEIQERSNAETTGVRLQVNEKILAACTSLMAAVMALVSRSRELQAEIVAGGKGSGSPRDFYKRNSQWSEGLLSAAKAVGVGAGILVKAADSAMVGEGKLEELLVASHEIAAATAQLVVASKVKAESGSERLTGLGRASKAVTAATADVLGTVNAARQTLDEAQALDFSNISIHQSKKMEMESQVKVLELESLLQKERVRLGQLRKNNYHSSEDSSSKEPSPEA